MWFVKSKGPDGQIHSKLMNDWNDALALRDEFLNKGTKSWIENPVGRTVGSGVVHEPRGWTT